MSRRNRHKKKKQRLQKKISHFAPISEKSIDEAEEDSSSETTEVEKTAAKSKEDSIIDPPTKKLIAKDVRLIAITLLGLVIILIAVKILQTKTGIIDNFGNWLYKISNIQTM